MQLQCFVRKPFVPAVPFCQFRGRHELDFAVAEINDVGAVAAEVSSALLTEPCTVAGPTGPSLASSSSILRVSFSLGVSRTFGHAEQSLSNLEAVTVAGSG